MAARFFLGVAEAGLFPGVQYYLSCWYKRSEFGIRSAIFFSAAALAGSFGGLLAAAIAQMDGIGGRPGWAWIFILVQYTFLSWEAVADKFHRKVWPLYSSVSRATGLFTTFQTTPNSCPTTIACVYFAVSKPMDSPQLSTKSSRWPISGLQSRTGRHGRSQSYTWAVMVRSTHSLCSYLRSSSSCTPVCPALMRICCQFHLTRVSLPPDVATIDMKIANS
jgi:MFS family permease